MLTLCTLFDHNYLDKGLAMYKSLERVCKDFELYVLAMSDRCYEILTDLNYPHIKPIKLEDFEDEELLKVKPTRKVGEYCWTCTASLIRYVLLNFKPDYCAYIDSDLCFYNDPIVVIDEMKERNASVQITGHRFNESNKYLADTVGRYCVEYNTFKNDEKALGLLEIWRNQCLEHCSIDGDGVYWGDQKYMDNWVDDYDFVIETQNKGMGIAPWNIDQYRKVGTTASGEYDLLCGDSLVAAVFYHFQGITYIDENHARMNISTKEEKVYSLAKGLYQDYLFNVRDIKSTLDKKYSLRVIMKKHPGVDEKYSLARLLSNIFHRPSLLINNRYIPVRFRKLIDRQIIPV